MTSSENISGSVPDASKLNIAYILYGLGCFTGFATIAGLIFAYLSEKSGHRQFLIRTFWLGLLFSVISFMLTVVMIGIPMLILVAIWMLVRIISGWIALNDGRDLENSKSLGFVAR